MIFLRQKLRFDNKCCVSCDLLLPKATFKLTMNNSETKFKPLTVIDLNTESSIKTSDYLNLPLCLINDHVVRMSIMTEPFYWHFHPNSDEIFLVIEGSIYIDLETHTVELLRGQLFTIPMNVKHRTRPKAERSVNLTFELNAIETVKLSV